MDDPGQTTSQPSPRYSYTQLAQWWTAGEFDKLEELDDANLSRLSFVLKRMKPRDKRWDNRRHVRYIGGIDV